jgi:hypothetical protein
MTSLRGRDSLGLALSPRLVINAFNREKAEALLYI